MLKNLIHIISFSLCLFTVGIDLVYSIEVVEVECPEKKKEKESEKESEKKEKEKQDKKKILSENLLIRSAVDEFASHNYFYRNLINGYFIKPVLPPPEVV